ncbi:MAG: hypothetical protein KGL44_11900 [Sphingomonadales bacterium]|nr:hypothetical protein [Sphingomonadales bacterium]
MIEGFPRSANTFSVVAFQQAQHRPVEIAHHLHAIAQVVSGVRQGIPVIVLIRKPEDSLRSLRVMFKQRGDDAALKRWIRFYTAIAGMRDKVVIAEFSRVIADFGTVIDEVNAKFGTAYARFEATPENIKAVYDEIDLINERSHHTSHGGKSMYVARPTEAKRQAHAKVEFKFDKDLLAQAHALYAELTA